MAMKQTRRDFLKTLSAGLLCSCASAPKAKRPPNFIIIFTDDQGYGDLGCCGAQGFQTPHLDQMAKQGVRFTDFYVPATVCTPSRAALLTGCYPKRVGLHEAVIYPFTKKGLNPLENTLPELLKPLGYSTACIGKWHLGHDPKVMPNNQGFDVFFGVPYSNDMDGHKYKNPPFQSPPLPLYRNKEQIESGPDQAILTRRYTREAVRFIGERGSSPFFLYLAHNMPHLPLKASKEFMGSSRRGLYGDVIQEIDWSVGEVLKALKENKLDRNTLVIFTSDNGPVLRKKAGSAGPLRGGKGSTWEGGPRVPCLALWPGRIPKGSVCNEMATTMDLFPTFLKLCGINPPNAPKIDGHDIRSLLFDPERAKTPYQAFYYYARNGKVEAIRQGPWKLHVAKSKGWPKKQGPFPVSLYHLKEDIGEKTNLAEKHPDLVDRLKRKMESFDSILSREARPAF